MFRRYLSGTVSGLYGAIVDSTAPTLSSPFGLPLGDTSAFQGVTTNEDNGTLYFLLTTSATPPSAAQVKAGQDHTGASATYAFGQPVTSTGIKSNTATGLTSNTAYYGYLMHEDAVGNQSAVSASGILSTLTTGTSDTSFDTLVAAMSVAPTNLRKGYIARFIGALYTAGVWSKMDVMWVLAAHDEQVGRLNWIDPASFTLTAVNSPTFTTDRGFAGNNSTSYLDTGWDWGTNGVQYTQNDCHMSVYTRTAGNGVPAFGQLTGGWRAGVGANPSNSDNGSTRVNSATTLKAQLVGASLPSWAMGRRNDSTNASLVKETTEVVAPSAATSTTGVSTTDFTFGNTQTFTNAQCAAGTLGAYLDDTEAAALYNAMYAYMVAIGADT